MPGNLLANVRGKRRDNNARTRAQSWTSLSPLVFKHQDTLGGVSGGQEVEDLCKFVVKGNKEKNAGSLGDLGK